MKITFRNYETNKDITLNSEKSLLVIYCKIESELHIIHKKKRRFRI